MRQRRVAVSISIVGSWSAAASLVFLFGALTGQTSAAEAQVAVGAQAHGDSGYWHPEPTFWGFGGTAAVDYVANDYVELGGRLRFATFPWRGQGTHTTDAGTEVEPPTGHEHYALSAAFRAHTALRAGRVSPYGQLSLGVGIWNGCIRGDSCGGVGGLIGAEAGIEVPFAERWSLVAGAQVLLQTGLANGVDWLWLPGVTLGVRLRAGVAIPPS